MKYLYLVFCIFLISVVNAQEEYQKATDHTILKGAYVITDASSEPQLLEIYIEGNVIKKIGKDLNIKGAARIINLDSQYIYPGFIFPAYLISEKRDQDNDRPKIDYWNPDPEIVGIHTDVTGLSKLKATNTDLKNLHSAGITAVQVIPGTGFITGFSSIIYTDYMIDESSPVIAESYTLYMNPNSRSPAYPQTKIGRYAKLDQIIQEARAVQNSTESETWFRKPQVSKASTHFANIVNKKKPLLMYARDRNSLNQVSDLENEHQISIIPIQYRNNMTKGTKLQQYKYLLINSEMPEPIDSATFYEENHELGQEELGKMWASIQNAEKNYFEEPYRQSSVAYSSTSSGKMELHSFLKEAIKQGVSKQKIIASVTSTPAEILGMQSYSGQISQQYIANLTILDAPIDSSDYKVSGVVVRGNYKEISTSKKPSGDKDLYAKISGTYDLQISSPTEQYSGVMKIDENGKGRISISELDLDAEIEDLSIENDKISWTINADFLGQNISADFSGTRSEDGSISGTTSTVELGQYTFNAMKNPENE